MDNLICANTWNCKLRSTGIKEKVISTNSQCFKKKLRNPNGKPIISGKVFI